MDQIRAALVQKGNASASSASAVDVPVSASTASAEDKWTADEIARCSKAMLKYPVGIPDRWQKVASAIGSKTADEV